MKAILALEDGRIFYGKSFTGQSEAKGEIVFNTSMTGYQEILTDPSYCGQIVTMTCPMIGNYGVNSKDTESDQIWASALVVRECQPLMCNHRAKASIDKYLAESNIAGIEGVDTRAITMHIRNKGAMRAFISTKDLDPKSCIEKANAIPKMAGLDLVSNVTAKKPYLWNNDNKKSIDNLKTGGLPLAVVIDFGVKHNILRGIEQAGFCTVVFPASVNADHIINLKPDLVVLSNGPGDPAALKHQIATVKNLIGKVRIAGICLGVQLIAHAFGGNTFKLKFGHRGANQPVKNVLTGKIEITSQNHGFAIDPKSLAGKDIEFTHINLNDGTIEGLKHKTLPVMGVQHHPEASPGPHDSSYFFNFNS